MYELIANEANYRAFSLKWTCFFFYYGVLSLECSKLYRYTFYAIQFCYVSQLGDKIYCRGARLLFTERHSEL